MGKNGNFDPCKIETLEEIGTQFVRIDYVHERSVCSKFGENPFTGTSGQHGEIPFCVTFYFFPGTNVEKRLDRF